ncbi:serine hydrolase-domain-containing protein [Sordaria brevicollis]|uniref:Serine hydrolase-domain-containing protein n=1 Tax=Sordaria brevicollis TaxID=83679 RepID=A0AAE0UC99_SORBR|nr:serine hydrolase-domain-containing protein [Sordaria brevicollis]
MGSAMQDSQPKMTRVLALHGYGTSGEIFRSQTAAFRLKLPKQSYHFHFPNAPLPSAPTVGVDSIWNQTPKFYAWWPAQTSNTSEIRASHDVLEEILHKEGPFDILMGFSQGCSLIMSYILYRYQEHLLERPKGEKFELPFKGVMFICGGPSLPVLQDLGVDVTDKAWKVNDVTAGLLHKRTERLKFKADNPDTIKKGEGLWDDVSDLVHDVTTDPKKKKGIKQLDETDLFGLDFHDERMRRVVGDLGELVPTVHVFGIKDPRWPASVQLVRMFEGGMNERFDHGGGHELPRTTECSVVMAELMEKLRRRVEGLDEEVRN